MRRIIIVLALSLIPLLSYSFSLRVAVQSLESGKPVSNILVGIDDLYLMQTTDAEGNALFSDVPPGYYQVRITGPEIGESSQSVRIIRDMTLTFRVSKKVYRLKYPRGYSSGKTSQQIERGDMQLLPEGMGDSLRSLQDLPGVGGGFTLAAVPVIRSGNPLYDRFYVDDYPIDFPYHFVFSILPLFSSLSQPVVDSAELIKGTSPMQYSDNLGNVVQIRTRSAEEPGFKASVLSEPLVPLIPSFSFSLVPAPELSLFGAGRRSLIDQVVDFKNSKLVFQDYFLKTEYNPNDGHQLTLTLLGSSDLMQFQGSQSQSGFDLEGLKWEFLISDCLFLKTVLSHYETYQEYQNTGADSNSAHIYLMFNPAQYRIFQTLNFTSGIHTVRIGWEALDHEKGVQGKITTSQFPDINILKIRDLNEVTNFPFRTNGINEIADFPIQGKSISVFSEYSLNFMAFWLNGGLKYVYYGPLSNSSVSYRLVSGYHISEKSEVYAGFGSYTAYPDMYYYLGSDIKNLSVIQSFNWNGGFKWKIFDFLSSQIEFFNSQFKGFPESDLGDLLNQNSVLNFNDYRVLLQNDPFSKENSGYAYGTEIYLKYQYRQYTGWISYTSAVSKRVLNGSPEYDSDFSQNNILRMVGMARLGKWEPSFVWNWTSSMPYTPITGGGPSYGGYNSKRFPDYQRLDLKTTYFFGGDSRVFIEVLNVLFATNYIFEHYDSSKPFTKEQDYMVSDYPMVWAGMELCF